MGTDAMTLPTHDGAAPIISVVLPVYNADGYVREAVESVLEQTFRGFELLALDDGSTDGSPRILRELEARDRRMHVISRENRGLVASLNELIRVARGRYLARMDADDICLPERFEKQVAYLETHPECVAVGSRSLFIDEQGMPICEHWNELAHDQIDSAHISGRVGSRICHPSTIMRREPILQLGGYREEYLLAEDLDLFLRLAEIGKLANLSEILIKYRHHARSICYTQAVKQRSIALKAVCAARQRRGLPVLPEAQFTYKPETKSELHRKWAWWALSAGNVITARKHAFKALGRGLLNIESLRVVACALRGY